MLINYKEQTGFIIDISAPRDENIQDKEPKKIDKYQSLKIELEQLWKSKIMVIPVVVSALGATADRLHGWLAQIPRTIDKVELQKKHPPRNGASPPMCSQTPRALVESRV